MESTRNDFDTKAKIVKSGESKVFADWHKHSNITEDEFITALEWLCNDPMPNGKIAREIGLSPSGLIRLERRYGVEGMCSFYKDGILWGGELFYREPKNENESLFADVTGKIPEIHKISINCKDRI